MKENLKKSAPWYGYVHKIMVLFGEDPEIHDIRFDENELILSLYVETDKKGEALAALLPMEKKFGSQTLRTRILPANMINEPRIVTVYRDAFEGNPVVREIRTVDGVFTNPITYISFRKEVVQYYDDNLGDLHGNTSTLMEDIAREIFEENDKGIQFCTDVE